MAGSLEVLKTFDSSCRAAQYLIGTVAFGEVFPMKSSSTLEVGVWLLGQAVKALDRQG